MHSVVMLTAVMHFCCLALPWMALWLVLSVIMPNVMMPIIDSANVFFYKTDMIA
jgi:hypothetical protein